MTGLNPQPIIIQSLPKSLPPHVNTALRHHLDGRKVENWRSQEKALQISTVYFSGAVTAGNSFGLLESAAQHWLSLGIYPIEEAIIAEIEGETVAMYPASVTQCNGVMLRMSVMPVKQTEVMPLIFTSSGLAAQLDPKAEALYARVVVPHNTGKPDKEARLIQWLLITLGRQATEFKVDAQAELEARDWANRFIRASSWRDLANYAQFDLIKTLTDEDAAARRGATMVREKRLDRQVIDTSDTFRVTRLWWDLALGK